MFNERELLLILGCIESKIDEITNQEHTFDNETHGARRVNDGTPQTYELSNEERKATINNNRIEFDILDNDRSTLYQLKELKTKIKTILY